MKRRNPITVDFFPVEQETLKAEQFLKLARDNPGLIKSSSVVPPSPGKPGFGSFLVKYTRPVYKHT